MPTKLSLVCGISIVGASLAMPTHAAGTTEATSPPVLSSATSPMSVCAAITNNAQKLQCLSDEDQIVNEELKLSEDDKKLSGIYGDGSDAEKSRELTIPNVLLIVGGKESQITADLAYSDGRTLNVHKGQIIPGGFVVSTISTSPAEVVLTHDGQQVVLLMGGGGSTNLSGGASSANTVATPAVAPIGSQQQ